MEVVILSKEQYDDMVIHIGKNKIISQNSKENNKILVNQQEFLQLINTSKRKRRVWLNANIFILVIKIIVEVWFCT